MEVGALVEGGLSVWVPFMDAEVQVRYVPLSELRELLKTATTARWNRAEAAASGAGGLSGEVDQAELSRLIGRAAVRGWKGLTVCGKDFPYSQENCDMLMARWLAFAKFVAEVCMDLIALERVARQESAKKSSLTSALCGTTPG